MTRLLATLMFGLTVTGSLARGDDTILSRMPWSTLLPPTATAADRKDINQNAPTQIRQALYDARNQLLYREADLNSWDNRQVRENFERDYGTTDPAVRDRIVQRIEREIDQLGQYIADLDKKTVNIKPMTSDPGFNPNDKDNPITFGYVRSSDATRTIYLGPQFFDKDTPRFGRDSRAGVFIHEISHFDESGRPGTKDAYLFKDAYGDDVAAIPRADRLNHADTFKYYIEGYDPDRRNMSVAPPKQRGPGDLVLPPGMLSTSIDDPPVALSSPRGINPSPKASVTADEGAGLNRNGPTKTIGFDDGSQGTETLPPSGTITFGYDENAPRRSASNSGQPTDTSGLYFDENAPRRDSRSPQERLLDSLKNGSNRPTLPPGARNPMDSGNPLARGSSPDNRQRIPSNGDDGTSAPSRRSNTDSDGLIWNGVRYADGQGNTSRRPPGTADYGPGTGRSGPEGQRLRTYTPYGDSPASGTPVTPSTSATSPSRYGYDNTPGLRSTPATTPGRQTITYDDNQPRRTSTGPDSSSPSARPVAPSNSPSPSAGPSMPSTSGSSGNPSPKGVRMPLTVDPKTFKRPSNNGP